MTLMKSFVLSLPGCPLVGLDLDSASVSSIFLRNHLCPVSDSVLLLFSDSINIMTDRLYSSDTPTLSHSIAIHEIGFQTPHQDNVVHVALDSSIHFLPSDSFADLLILSFAHYFAALLILAFQL